MNSDLRNKIAAFFEQASQAHHKAFEAVDGADPDWPIWYAEFLRAPLSNALRMEFSLSKLIYCLMDADFEHRVRASESNWAMYYADHLLERFAESETVATDKLALYHYDGCPFCALVRSAIDRLGVEVELRNIYENTIYRTDLVAARGRSTVPVLRIASADGEDRWMPESQDIVRYLDVTYA